jgi:hypothetical protein
MTRTYETCPVCGGRGVTASRGAPEPRRTIAASPVTELARCRGAVCVRSCYVAFVRLRERPGDRSTGRRAGCGFETSRETL